MLTDIFPILSALRRHRLTASLVVLEIALTCAIVCNAIFLIGDRLGQLSLPSGIDEQNVVHIAVSDIGKFGDAHARTETDLAALREIPGVVSATILNSVPFGPLSWNSGIRLTATQKVSTVDSGNVYGERAGETLGTRLIAGRYFNPDEYVWLDDVIAHRSKQPGVVVVTEALAHRVFGDGSALGKSIYIGDATELRVVGVVEHLARAGMHDRNGIDFSILIPLRETTATNGSYVMRTQPGQSGGVLTRAVEKLKQIEPRRVIVEQNTYGEIRAKHFAGDRAMAGMLVGVCVILLIVTALGIVGLASFWVGQRRRQIGVRRALGARRVDVLRYFQTENFLLASMGIVLGMVLAYGINLILMREYELPRLPFVYLPVGAAVLWALGQAAVLAPALRAASVPPVVATRG
jgi:putative ABC transport system permease protein